MIFEQQERPLEVPPRTWSPSEPSRKTRHEHGHIGQWPPSGELASTNAFAEDDHSNRGHLRRGPAPLLFVGDVVMHRLPVPRPNPLRSWSSAGAP